MRRRRGAAATLDRFGQILPFEPAERARLDRAVARHRRFIPVLVRDFLDWQQMAAIEANAPDLPGIVIDVGTARIYPTGDSLAHVVGYVAPPSEREVEQDPLLALPGIRVGRAGVEQYQEAVLRGRAGQVQLEVSPVGRVVRELNRQEGMPGPDLGLTIDTGLQRAVIDRLGEESASAVVMDCTNGEILAMASNPSFDPSLFDAGVSETQWLAWNADPRTPLLNKPVAGLYAPGSTFKMAVALAALRGGVLTPGDRIDCPGYIDIGNARFHCWKKGGHGSLDLHGALMHSCDVFFYETALRAGMDRVAALAHVMGLGTKLDVEQPDARTGLIPTRAWRERHGHHWNRGDTVVAGIGQGFIQVTPLQLATYVARIASGAGGGAAPDADTRRGDAARRGGDGLAGAGCAAADAGGGAVGDVGGGERSGGERAAGAADAGWGADGGQDRVGAGAAGFALGAGEHGFRFLEGCPGRSGRMRCSWPLRRPMRRALRCRW